MSAVLVKSIALLTKEQEQQILNSTEAVALRIVPNTSIQKFKHEKTVCKIEVIDK